MAEFCNQCADELGFDHDFDYDRGRPSLEPGYGWLEICESCGPTFVDDKGFCMGCCLKRKEHYHEVA